MQYKQFLTIVLLVALVLLWPITELSAAFNTFQTDTDTTINISDLGINLTIKSGAKVEQMVVRSDSISLDMQSGSTITIESSDRRGFSVSGFTSASQNCPSTGASSVVITSVATETGLITPLSTQCSATSDSSSGGTSSGGGTPAPAVVAPSNTSITIAAGVSEISASEVTLNLSATNASQMMISNLASFSGAAWETYTATKTWTLSSGLGKKTVYVKFKNSADVESSVISDDIMLLPVPAVEAITASQGKKFGLADNIVAVDVPAGALSGDGNVSITPTASYNAPSSGKVLGGRVYDLKAAVGGVNVSTFSKDLTITFAYTADEIKDIDESTLAVHYWNTSTSLWTRIGGVIDKENKTVTATTDHFTLFALMGDEGYASGDLVKLECDGTNDSICDAVYYLGNDGKRYVFPNSKTYFTWYDDFSAVKIISADQLASYTIGGNVNYRPGVKMVKVDTDPKVYVVGKTGELRWVNSESLAQALYGTDWNKKIDDIPDAFFFSYSIGTEIASASDFDVSAEKAAATTINMNKGL